jgi:hypothetical protein
VAGHDSERAMADSLGLLDNSTKGGTGAWEAASGPRYDRAVSKTDTSEEMAPAVPAKVSTPHRGSRPRTRNVKISGPEWVNV